MNPYYKPLLHAVAIIIEACALIGCASSHRLANTSENPGKSNRQDIVLDQQVNLTHLHPDTHPEWRLGMDMAFPHPPGNFDAARLSNAVGQPEF